MSFGTLLGSHNAELMQSFLGFLGMFTMLLAQDLMGALLLASNLSGTSLPVCGNVICIMFHV